jgi:hypothetical protein
MTADLINPRLWAFEPTAVRGLSMVSFLAFRVPSTKRVANGARVDKLRLAV